MQKIKLLKLRLTKVFIYLKKKLVERMKANIPKKNIQQPIFTYKNGQQDFFFDYFQICKIILITIEMIKNFMCEDVMNEFVISN